MKYQRSSDVMTSFPATNCSCLGFALLRNSYVWHHAMKRTQLPSCLVGLLYDSLVTWHCVIVAHFLSERFPIIFYKVEKYEIGRNEEKKREKKRKRDREGVIKESARGKLERGLIRERWKMERRIRSNQSEEVEGCSYRSPSLSSHNPERQSGHIEWTERKRNSHSVCVSLGINTRFISVPL